MWKFRNSLPALSHKHASGATATRRASTVPASPGIKSRGDVFSNPPPEQSQTYIEILLSEPKIIWSVQGVEVCMLCCLLKSETRFHELVLEMPTRPEILLQWNVMLLRCIQAPAKFNIFSSFLFNLNATVRMISNLIIPSPLLALPWLTSNIYISSCSCPSHSHVWSSWGPDWTLFRLGDVCAWGEERRKTKISACGQSVKGTQWHHLVDTCISITDAVALHD